MFAPAPVVFRVIIGIGFRIGFATCRGDSEVTNVDSGTGAGPFRCHHVGFWYLRRCWHFPRSFLVLSLVLIFVHIGFGPCRRDFGTGFCVVVDFGTGTSVFCVQLVP